MADARSRTRRTVGRTVPRPPLDVVWRLRGELAALGLLPPNPDGHVRKRVGRADADFLKYDSRRPNDQFDVAALRAIQRGETP